MRSTTLVKQRVALMNGFYEEHIHSTVGTAGGGILFVMADRFTLACGSFAEEPDDTEWDSELEEMFCVVAQDFIYMCTKRFCATGRTRYIHAMVDLATFCTEETTA